MPALDRDGVDVFLEVTGGGSQTPVLLTHGFSADHHCWQPTVEHLATERTCVTFDVRGHGSSAAPPDPDRYSPELAVADMAAVLDAAGIDRAVLVGHSMGGYLSMRFEMTHPERVAALVLVDTGPGYRNPEARQRWNDTCESMAARIDERGAAGLGRSGEVAAARHLDVAGVARAARGILRQHDAAVVDRLPAIGVPTLVVVGSDDRAYLDGSGYMAAKIPGARLEVVEGAGHAPMVTHTARFLEVLDAFLAQAP